MCELATFSDDVTRHDLYIRPFCTPVRQKHTQRSPLPSSSSYAGAFDRKGLKMAERKRGETKWLILALLILVPLEIYCAEQAFETIGEITSAMYWVLVIAGNLFVVMLAFIHRQVAIGAAFLLALLIVPHQLLLIERHAAVRSEATRIVAYACETKKRTGAYPADLSQYEFANPSTREFIQAYHPSDRTGFRVAYYVGTRSTSHWYSPAEGWCYYPD